jgi:hypothetical protein
MIFGAHVIVYRNDAAADRTFFQYPNIVSIKRQ